MAQEVIKTREKLSETLPLPKGTEVTQWVYLVSKVRDGEKTFNVVNYVALPKDTSKSEEFAKERIQDLGSLEFLKALCMDGLVLKARSGSNKIRSSKEKTEKVSATQEKLVNALIEKGFSEEQALEVLNVQKEVRQKSGTGSEVYLVSKDLAKELTETYRAKTRALFSE